LTTRSPIRSVPSVISSSPAIIRRLVVLPQPDGPTSTMNSPSWISRLKSSTAVTSPYFLVTWSNVTVAIWHLVPPGHRGSLHPAAFASWTDPVRGAGVVGGSYTRRRLLQCPSARVCGFVVGDVSSPEPTCILGSDGAA
jgi:hypothetical protein